MAERIIWRPNSFTVEEWEGLSREQQIDWWKNPSSQGFQQSSPHPSRAIKNLRNDFITEKEFLWYVYRTLTPSNLPEFIADCPQHLLSLLKDDAHQFPPDNDDEGWSNVIFIHAGACYAPWVTREDIEAGRREEHRRLREGVRLIREAQNS